MLTKTPVRVLVTGASGLLGGNLLNSAPLNWEITGVINKHKIKPAREGIEIIQVDLLSANLDECFKKYEPFDAVIHTAALTDVDKCEQDKQLADKLNTELAKRIALYCAGTDTYFVHFSTDHIFDGEEKGYTEESEPTIVNYYAKTKLAAEYEIQKSGADYIIIRTNFFGFNIQDKRDLAGWIVASLKAGESINLFTDVFFSPILVNYLIKFIVETVERKFTGIFHIAGADSCSKYEFGIKLAEAFKFDKTLISSSLVNLKVRRPKNMRLNVAKAAQRFTSHIPKIDESIVEYKQLLESGYKEKIKDLF